MTFTPAAKEMQVLQQGGGIFTPASAWTDAVVLTANTAHTYSLTALRTALGYSATQALFLIISADGPFWTNFQNAAAAIPSGNVTTGTASEFCPNQRLIDGSLTQISFIAAAAQNISIQVFRP